MIGADELFDTVMIACILAIILMFIKTELHFRYLKEFKNKFQNIDSMTDLIFRPFSTLPKLFGHLPDLFVAVYYPILWYKGKNSLLKKIMYLSYAVMVAWLIVFLAGYSLAHKID